MSKPTPRPWRVEQEENEPTFVVAEHGEIAKVYSSHDNAAHLVKCVNMHEELLEALKLALKIGVTRICSSEEAEQIESAIAKAEAP